MTDLPRVGLGAAPLGGLFAPVAEDIAHATLDAAVAHGWTHVDTAPLYGHGLSEARVGSWGGDAVISTKVGRLVRPVDEREPGDLFLGAPPGTATFDFSADGVRRSLDASLQRLRRDRVDIALVHDPDDHLDQAIAEAVPALRADERALAIGVGTNECDLALRFVRDADIDVLLIAGRWTLLDRSAGEELLPLCAARRVQVIVGGVFNSGVLADPSGGTYAYGDVPPDVRARLDTIVAACERHGVPLPAAALQLPFRHPAVTSIVVGCRSPEEVARNAELLAAPVPDALWEELGA